MNKIIRNMLPQDTRAVEFPSAVGLILTALFMTIGLILDHPMLKIHPIEFWIVFSFLIGGLQFFALLEHPSHEMLRTAMCWVSGSFWIWASFSTHLDVASLASFGLGFSNIVAFIINTVLLSEKWNSF